MRFALRSRKEQALLVMLSVWSMVAALFGAQLYLSVNESLANPVVRPLIPAAKDALWVSIMFCTVALVWRPVNPSFYGRKIILLVSFSGFAFSALVLNTFCSNQCEYAVFALVKNFLFYTIGGLLVGYIFVNMRLEIPALKIIGVALLIAVGISIVLFVFVEFEFKLIEWRRSPSTQIPVLRMFGTMGNPNSIGWSGVLAIPLVLIWPYFSCDTKNRERSEKVAASALIILTAGVFLSGSLSAVAGAAVVIVSFLFLTRWIATSSSLSLLRISSAVAFGFVVAALLASIATDHKSLEVIDRVFAMFGTLGDKLEPGPDSVLVRLQALDEISDEIESGSVNRIIGLMGTKNAIFTQYDSVVLTLFRNFGAIGVCLFLLPYILVVPVVLWRAVGERGQRSITNIASLAFVPSYVGFVLLNLPFQYQLQVFPLNFFFAFLTGLWVSASAVTHTVWLHPNKSIKAT